MTGGCPCHWFYCFGLGMLHWVSSGTLLGVQECHQVAVGEAVTKGLNDDGLMNLGGRPVSCHRS